MFLLGDRRPVEGGTPVGVADRLAFEGDFLVGHRLRGLLVLGDDVLAQPDPTRLVGAEHVRAFAELLTTRRGTDLADWMSAVESVELPDCTPSSADYTRTSTPSSPG